MQFFTLQPRQTPERIGPIGAAYLIEDRWDDYTFKTQFYLIYRDQNQQLIEIGAVKIAHVNMVAPEQTTLPYSPFTDLPEGFFSVGQDRSYYENLKGLGDEARETILKSLRDVAFDSNLFQATASSDVAEVSLYREITRSTVVNQFRRIARGGANLTPFRFWYIFRDQPDLKLLFDVTLDVVPPTNVHVVIGRNGVGKTTLLNDMAAALAGIPGVDGSANGRVAVDVSADPKSAGFASVVAVSFSAFDNLAMLSEDALANSQTSYTYVGLRRRPTKERPGSTKDFEDLVKGFVDSAFVCSQGPRRERWRRALLRLESDPVFAEEGVSGLTAVIVGTWEPLGRDRVEDLARSLFRRLSAGHRIVLLSITALVENVDERSLVLLDEPEAHLHPPLLSAFLRALSDLLVDRNGVAVVATHSPVVLQEVPASCVWRLDRSGTVAAAARPSVETFGEGVGALTHEIFGLEVANSGFYSMIAAAIEDGATTMEDLTSHFGGRLGGEARSIARAVLSTRRRG